MYLCLCLTNVCICMCVECPGWCLVVMLVLEDAEVDNHVPGSKVEDAVLRCSFAAKAEHVNPSY